MDLICCHKRGRKLLNLAAAAFSDTTLSARASRASLAQGSEPDFDVILSIIKADLPGNSAFMGSGNLYTAVRWEGDASMCEWHVAATPTLWVSSTAPEWHHALPAQPRAALRSQNSQVAFEVVQDGYALFGSRSTVGAAAVPASSLLEELLEGPYTVVREMTLWREDDDVGSITVQVSVESPKAPMFPSVELEHKPEVCRRASSPRGRADSGKESDARREDKQASALPISFSWASIRNGSPSPARSPRKASPARSPLRKGSFGGGHRRTSSNTTTSSSGSQADPESSAHALAAAMLRQWERSTDEEALRRKAMQHQVRTPSRSPATSPARAPKVSSTAPLRTPSPSSARKPPHTFKNEPKTPAPSSLKELIKRLRVTAKKYPKNGIGLVQLSKERFFAIAKEEDGSLLVRSGPPNGGGLVLSWFENKAAWKRRARPLDSIPLAGVCSAVVDNHAVGFIVSIKFMEIQEDNVEPGQLRVLFASLPAAEDWCRDLNRVVQLLQRP